MRIAWHRMVVGAGLLAASVLTPAARAQAPVRVSITGSSVLVSSPTAPPIVGGVPVVTSIRVATTVSGPDGGTVLVGGYSRLSESRTELGPPVLSKLPYAGRVFRNTAYGRDVVSVRVTASVRVIDLREEEFRQTGFRSP
jgi:type II secretory pathway component GspD/PulD (secretin)